MELLVTGAVVADPTFVATAATYAAALVLLGVAGVLRVRRGERADGVQTTGGYGPAAVWTSGGGPGRVDVRVHGKTDQVGVAWITGIYIWLSLAQVAAAAARDGAGARAIGVGDLWVSIGFQFFMAGLVIVIMAPRLRAVDWLGLRWAGWRMVLVLAPLAVVGMWGGLGILHMAGYTRWLESLDVETVQDSVRALRLREDVWVVALMGFAAVIVAPLCEEVVFRGYLYGVAKRYCGPFAAALGSALIFSAAHASLVALLPLALFGLLLAWLYERTGSLWAPVAAHACFNAGTVAVQLWLHP